MKRTALLSVLCLAVGAGQAQEVIYVNHDATGENDGTSWADAFVFLQDAVADSGDEVWVVEGICQPDRERFRIVRRDRSVSLEIAGPIQLYGGFAGSETTRDSRNPGLQTTALSGDLPENDDAR